MALRSGLLGIGLGVVLAGAGGCSRLTGGAVEPAAIAAPEADFRTAHEQWKRKRFPEALKAYRTAADAGHAGAQLMIGAMYFDGTGVAQDDGQAAHWFRLAATRGNARAKYNLAWMMLKDRAEQQRADEGVDLMLQAADASNADAQFMVAHACLDAATNADYPKGFELAKQAAEQGHVEAQGLLGTLYAEGRGTLQNPIEAYAWLSVAAAQSSGYAFERHADQRNRVARSLNAEQLKEGRESAEGSMLLIRSGGFSTLQAQISAKAKAGVDE